MSLQKQLIHLNMKGGMDKGSDDKIMLPSKMVVAENVDFSDADTLMLRKGLSDETVDGAEPVKRLIATKRLPLVQYKSGHIGTLLEDSFSSKFAGTRANTDYPTRFPRASAEVRTIQEIPTNGELPDTRVPILDRNYDVAYSATSGTFALVYEAPTDVNVPGVAWSIREYGSNLEIVGGIIKDSTYNYSKPRVVYESANNRYVLFMSKFDPTTTTYVVESRYIAATGVSSGLTSALTVLTVTTTANVESASSSQVSFDVSEYVNSLAVVAALGNNTVYACMASVTGAISVAATTQTMTACGGNSVTCYAVNSSGNTIGHIFSGDVAGVTPWLLRRVRFPSNTGVLSTADTIESSADHVFGGIAVFPGTDSTLNLVVDRFPDVYTNQISIYNIPDVHVSTVSSYPVNIYGCWISGRIFTIDSRYYIPVIRDSYNFQVTTAVMDLSGILEAQAAGGGGSPTAYPHLLARLDYGECFFAPTYRSRLDLTCRRIPSILNNNTVPYLRNMINPRLINDENEGGVALSFATLSTDSQLVDAALNDVIYLAGACPLMFDGKNVYEAEFSWGPEILPDSASDTPTTSGTYGPFPVGTVTYCLTLAFTDAAGNWHESAPSGEVTCTFAGPDLYVTPTPILPPTLVGGQDYQILMYRTMASSTDTSLYLTVSSEGNTNVNIASTNGAFVTSDTTLAGSEQLYTSGEVFPNEPAPACRAITTFQNRLVFSGLTDPQRVAFSKATNPGYGVEFTSDSSHYSRVPSSAGRAVSSAELDDKLFVVCEDAIGVIYGQGPSPNGLSGGYSSFSTIVAPTGCDWDSPKSVLATNEGVWFRAQEGIRLVGRNGTLAMEGDKDFGAELDPSLTGNVITVQGNERRVRFYTGGDVCFVWDCQTKQWARWTNHTNVDACFSGGRFFHTNNHTSGTLPLLRYMNSAINYDVSNSGATGTLYAAYIETPWLSFAGISGFQRVSKVLLTGQDTLRGSASTQNMRLIISAAYDFSQATLDALTQLVSAQVAITQATGGKWRTLHHLATQKCDAMKLGITWRPDTYTDLCFPRLSDITLQVGVKSGASKIPSAGKI